MQACRSREETLMLDVLGEITDSGERRSWTAHLAGCAGCRLERQRMMALLSNLRAAGAPPELTPAGARSMALRVRQARGERKKPETARARWRFMGAPALAAACALVVAGLTGYMARDRFFGPERVAGLGAELQLPEQDLDVIRNLDLLKELDTIEKLVQIEELLENGREPEDGQQQETQGMQSEGKDHGYA